MTSVTFKSFKELQDAAANGSIDLTRERIGSIFYVRTHAQAILAEFLISNYGNARDAYQFGNGINVIIEAKAGTHAYGLYTTRNYENSSVKTKFPYLFTPSKIDDEHLNAIIKECCVADKKELKAMWEEIAHDAGWPRLFDNDELISVRDMWETARAAEEDRKKNERAAAMQNRLNLIQKEILPLGYTQMKDYWGSPIDSFKYTPSGIAASDYCIRLCEIDYENKKVTLQVRNNGSTFNIFKVPIANVEAVTKSAADFMRTAYNAVYNIAQ